MKGIKMSEIVYFDSKGIEIRRVSKTRGRPPKGSVRQPDGNFHICEGLAPAIVIQNNNNGVNPTPIKSKNTFIVYIDSQGNETRRIPKTRGRPPRNSIHKPDGNFYVYEGSSSPIQSSEIKQEETPEENTKEIFKEQIPVVHIDTKIVKVDPLPLDIWEKVFARNVGKKEENNVLVFNGPYVMANVPTQEINMFNCVYSKAEIDTENNTIKLWVRRTIEPKYVMYNAIEK